VVAKNALKAQDRVMSNSAALEFAHLARDPSLGGLELLYAHYVTHRFSPHSHCGYAIGVILEGAQNVKLAGDRTVFPAGNLAVIEPQTVHTGHARTASGWRYRMMYPSVAQMESIALELGYARVPHFVQSTFFDPELAAFMTSTHTMLSESSRTVLERQSQFLELMTLLMSRHGQCKAPQITQGREPVAVARVRALLEDDLSRAWTLDELSQEVNLSRFYLLRSFREVVGLPPHAYQTNLRVGKAKRMLECGVGVAEVALECGFFDQSHLGRTFKRVVGIGPGQYARASLGMALK
jgi:AraC-like DNA-binding protein